MDATAALLEIGALKSGLDETCDALMTQAERGLALAMALGPEAQPVSDVFVEILSLCSFQDLAGQRLTRLSGAITNAGLDNRPDAHLLNGPANAGGLDQAAADSLFDAV